jgi:hypothetical protein
MKSSSRPPTLIMAARTDLDGVPDLEEDVVQHPHPAPAGRTPCGPPRRRSAPVSVVTPSAVARASEIAADLALDGATARPIHPFRLARFREERVELPDKMI